MHAADEIVLAVPKTASEENDAESRIAEFEDQYNNGHL
jgi:hypothetical protein